MDSMIMQLAPQELWRYFVSLNAVPRASKKEERVIQFMMDFGNSLGLETSCDHVGNVLIRKPATAGLENRQTVVLQSHLDMVHQKNNETVFDFDRQGIIMYVEGDWVKAEGTTLGADNGIGVASIMAVLASTDLAHPAIEALFTVDEETGMTGAKGLQADFLQGDILLNLDTELDSEIDIGCAGGVDVTASFSYSPEDIPAGTVSYALAVKGLQGGHSGMEIHKGLGNANKIINRILFELQPLGVRLVKIEGGGLRNAIPRESVAYFVVNVSKERELFLQVEHWRAVLQSEYDLVDEGLDIQLTEMPLPSDGVLPLSVQDNLIRAIYAAPNGVYRMSTVFDGLVEASNNIARVEVGEGKIVVKCLTRSSVESSKADLTNALKACFELIGAKVELAGDYPGWSPNPNSAILGLLTSTYQQLFGQEPEVVACHAGLECGLLGSHYPQMEMISFGPTILGAHSPQERVSIASVQKFWKFLCAILKDIPYKTI